MRSNKIREYIIIKDDVSHAKLEEIGRYDYNGDLSYTDDIYQMLNDVFKVDKLLNEVSYVIAFDHDKKPKGICKIGQGSGDKTPMPLQSMFTFLLLVGANSFICIHNHVSYKPEASTDDKCVTLQITNIATSFSIEFIGHMIIHPKGYLIQGGMMDGTMRETDEYGEMFDCVYEDEDEEDTVSDSNASVEALLKAIDKQSQCLKKWRDEIWKED